MIEIPKNRLPRASRLEAHRLFALRWPARLGLLVLVALLAGSAMASAGTTESADLGSRLEAFDSPTILAEMDPPEILKVGRATVRPAAGAKLFVFAVDGREVGWVLDGSAQLTYRVEDRFSIPPAKDNLKRADGIDVRETEGVLVASTSISGAAVWGWDLEVEGEARPAAGRPLPAWLEEMMEEKYSLNPGRDLLFSDANGNPGFRWAIFDAKGEALVLDVDPRPISRRESLMRLTQARRRGDNPFTGRRFLRRLADQPIGQEWWDPTAVELVSVKTEVELKNRQKNHATVKTRTQLQSARDGLRLLSISHQSGVFRNDGEWRGHRITSLTLDGKPTTYVHRQGTVLIELPEALKRGQKLLLETESEGEILVRPSGDNYWRLGLEAWYPRPGAGGNEWAEIHIDAEVQAPYKVFASGELIESAQTESASRVKTLLKAPMDRAVVIAGKYETVTEEANDFRVHVSSYAAVKKKEANRIAQVILSIQDCLGVWLGVPYPFQDLQVVEVNQWGWGQAPPGVIFITQEAFLTRASANVGDGKREIASIVSRGINERVSHEVAHAWFPHVAKIVRGEENWLSESLSDYASAVCLQQKLSNKKKGKQLFDRQLQEWKNFSREAGTDTSVYLAHHLSGNSDAGQIRRFLLYGRGPLVLHTIRQKLTEKHGEDEGDRIFLTWIRSYIRNFTFKVAETRHLVTILNQVSGEDWQPFFERHIYGVEPPELK